MLPTGTVAVFLICYIIIEISVKIHECTIFFQYPHPFPVGLLRCFQIPQYIPADDQIKALIFKIQILGIHPEKCYIHPKVRSILSRLSKHIFCIINGRYFIPHLCQQNREKSWSASHIQHRMAGMPFQRLLNPFFPDCQMRCILQLLPAAQCISFRPTVPVLADFFQCLTHVTLYLPFYSSDQYIVCRYSKQASLGDNFLQKRSCIFI